MSVSFADSLKKNEDNAKSSRTKLKTASTVFDAAANSTISTSDIIENWSAVTTQGYEFYNEYGDDNYSVVDEFKNISINRNQINITQETNSQYIPFQMPRYYDGFDLASTKLQIYFVNREGYYAFDYPVNVYASDTKIKFAWLVDSNATMLSGKLQFEIQAVGHNSKGETYIWKTRPNGELNVLESLAGSKFIEPDDTWKEDFLFRINEKVSIAEAAADSAKESAANSEKNVADAKKYADEAKSAVDGLLDGISDEVTVAVDTQVGELISSKIQLALDDYYDKSEVDSLLSNVDISDQINDIKAQIANLDGLANFDVEYDGQKMTFYNGQAVMKEIEINSDPSISWTNTYTQVIEEKISEAKVEVQGNLDAYEKKTDDDLLGIHDTIDGLPDTLATNYYTKEASDEKFSEKSDVDAVNGAMKILSSTVDGNTHNIDTLSKTVTKLSDDVTAIDKSPRLTYEATYDDEQIYTLWEISGEGDSEIREPKGQFKITGGGGQSSNSVLKIEYITKTPLVATVNDRIIISYNFSGTDTSGDAVLEGSATWKIGGRAIATNAAVDGENSFDITDYIGIGTQKVVLSISDDAGSLVTKSWTVQKIDVRLESAFNDKLTYPMDKVSFNYTPYGSVNKTVHFILDGYNLGTIDTTASGIPQSYDIPVQSYGSHLLEVYMTAEVNGNTITSNRIYKDIIWFDPDSEIPVIGCAQKTVYLRQYDVVTLSGVVYDPTTETPTISMSVDGEIVSTQQIHGNVFNWQYKGVDVGAHTLMISCNGVEKVVAVNVEKLDINVSPVTAGLVFDFNPVGYSNSSADRPWKDDNVEMTVSDNFDWVNGGYQTDSDGDPYFCIKAGTSAEINYKLFADDAKRSGKEFKLIFKSTNVARPDAQFLRCMDGATDIGYIGIEMNVHEAYIYGRADMLHLPYSENDVIEFEFNISNNTETIPMVMGYEDGVSTAPMVYDDSFSFTQDTPSTILMGSPDCDLHIYRFKVYGTSLSDRDILNNYISDARNAEEMISRYNRNQIYDENGKLDPDILAEKRQDLRIIKIEAPHFTNDKTDKVTGTNIEHIFRGGDPILDNWKAYDCMHCGQGTSSNKYGAAGRNLDLMMNKSGVDGVKPRIVLGDGSETTKVSFTRNSIPTNYCNIKVNIASSENANNALLQRRYNEHNPVKRAFVRDDPTIIPKIKDTMEFHNCVVFIRETDSDVSTHQEFADSDWHFYAIGNIGDSKKTDETRLTDPSDKYECIVEIMDVNLPNSSFPGGESGLAALEADQFDESGTYGFRYIWKNGTSEENQEVKTACMNAWKDFYKFVVNSSDEEFYAHLGDYFVVDSAIYFYLFTLRYTMCDNRAKNTFWHYGKTGEVDSDGSHIRKWDLCFDYDNDTALGINNYGDLVYRYGYEDTDVDDAGEEVFRESGSTFFCRIRDLFPNEQKAMYNTLESKGTWHAESTINQFDAWQATFPEELWRIDTERKYIRTYNSSFIGGAGDAQFLRNMAKGRKKYQRRQFERNQEAYMASKFQSSLSTSDSAVLRCTVPGGDLPVVPNYRLKLTPYSYMYLNVRYGTMDPIQIRAIPNVEYEIPFSGNSADIIDIYSISSIQSLGDLSSCYAATIDTSKASKLKELMIGNSTPGYDNPYLTTLTLGANVLLEKLDVTNVSGLTQTLNLSALTNLRELYAKGSNAGGVTFADGGRIEIAELPAINSMTMKNLMYLTSLDIVSTERLTSLVVENCDMVDLVGILQKAKNLNRVRITGIDWSLTDSTLLERIYEMKGIDGSGYNSDRSVLSGHVHIPVARQQQIVDYHSSWPDLDITYDTLIEQFPVTFLNDNGSVIEVQYVDKGGTAEDPTTRENNPIIPGKESTVSHDFTFDGWDSTLDGIFSDRTVTATYSSTLRSYSIKYVSNGIVKQESTGLYGENIPYDGDIPVYTAEEPAYVYYLFNRWDKSGFIDGDKVVNALFDKFEYSPTSFEGKRLSDLSPVEIYAMNKLDKSSSIIEDKDTYTVTIGNDVEYDDIDSEIIVKQKISFNGDNHLDTGLKLFDEDRDFVIAIDYKFIGQNENNAVLAQCYQSNGSNGFKLLYGNTSGNAGVKFAWGTSFTDIVSENKREMVVIRHKRGENSITIYNSALDEDDVIRTEITRTRDTITDSTLVFGASKADDGMFESYAIGEINWCKIWYRDLGDGVCKDLALWTHETVEFEARGFRKYYLSDNASKRCSFSLLATHLLDRNKSWGSAASNVGGYWESELNKILNDRLYRSFPSQIRSLIKCVKVPASIGGMSNDIKLADCYITIPSCIEVDPTMTNEPYVNEGSTTSYLVTNNSRKRAYADGSFGKYLLRSCNSQYSNYIWTVNVDGSMYGFNMPYSEAGVLIELSF